MTGLLILAALVGGPAALTGLALAVECRDRVIAFALLGPKGKE